MILGRSALLLLANIVLARMVRAPRLVTDLLPLVAYVVIPPGALAAAVRAAARSGR